MSWKTVFGVLAAAAIVGGGGYGAHRVASYASRGTGSERRRGKWGKVLSRLGDNLTEQDTIIRVAGPEVRKFKGTRLAGQITVQLRDRTKDSEVSLKSYFKDLISKVDDDHEKLTYHWNELTGKQQRLLRSLRPRIDSNRKRMIALVPSLEGETRQGNVHRLPVAAQEKKIQVDPSRPDGQMQVDAGLFQVAVQSRNEVLRRHDFGSQGFWDRISGDWDLMGLEYAIQGQGRSPSWGAGKVVSPTFKQRWDNGPNRDRTFLNKWARAYSKFAREYRDQIGRVT